MPAVVKFTETKILATVNDDQLIGSPVVGDLIHICYPEGIYEATIMYMSDSQTNADERCKELIILENNSLLTELRKQGPSTVRMTAMHVQQESDEPIIKQEIFNEPSVPDSYSNSNEFIGGESVNTTRNGVDDSAVSNSLLDFDKNPNKQTTINSTNYNLGMNGTSCTNSIPALVNATGVHSIPGQIVLMQSGGTLPAICISGTQQTIATSTLTLTPTRVMGDDDRLIVERVQDILRCAQSEKLDTEKHCSSQFFTIRELNELKNQCNHSVISFAKHLATRLFSAENSTLSNGAKTVASDRVKWLRATINNMFPVGNKHDEFKRWEQIVHAMQEIGLSVELFLSSLNGDSAEGESNVERFWVTSDAKTVISNSEQFFENNPATTSNAILGTYWSDVGVSNAQSASQNDLNENSIGMSLIPPTSDGTYGPLSMALCQHAPSQAEQQDGLQQKSENAHALLLQYFDGEKSAQSKSENKSRTRQRERRAQETPEERARRLEKQRERNRLRFEMETAEERQARLARLSIKAQLRRSQETAEQRSKRLHKCREYARQRRQRETYEEWQQRLLRVRQNQARWWQNLPEEAKKQRWQTFSRKWREKHSAKSNDSDSQSFTYESS